MARKARFDVHVLLPNVPHAGDACFRRIFDALEAKVGVEAAHLIERPGGEPGQLCVHFDPNLVSLQDVRRFAEQSGAELQKKYGHFVADMSAMRPGKAKRLTAELSRANGVLEAVAAPNGSIRIEFDRELIDEAGLAAMLDELGPVRRADGAPTTPSTHGEEDHVHGGILGANTELIFVGLSGVTLLTGWLLESYLETAWVASGILIASYCFGGFFTLREAIANIRARRFEIDSLMLVAAAGAAALGKWAEGALLLFLFSLGHALEHYAMGRAKRAIEALGELSPKSALVRRDGQVMQIAIAELRIGDTALVKPNERLPADGFVVKGESSVNQAPITGESVPVDKQPVKDADRAARNPNKVAATSRVFAGTINGAGALEIRVTRTSGDSTLARVVKMVREAEMNRSPSQQFTDRVERVFVPAVLVGAGLLLFAWLVVDEPFSASFYRAMALLVAASPCALAIATPSAVLSGIARAARGGVLIKGGAPLENLGRLRAIAFDKTGTLTEGKPRLVDVAPVGGVTEEELLRVAVAVEAVSDHPLATAVVNDGKKRLGGAPAMDVSNLRSITGRGVQALVDGDKVLIGKAVLFAEVDGPALPTELRAQVDGLETAGRTVMIVRKGARYLGAIGLMDTPRQSAKGVVGRLRRIGIHRMIMITGDNQKVADAVARDIGIDEARGDLMPDDKVETIKSLRREAMVAMVGDGVNDAPAMANATVGIAMGAAGSDVALETADVALMADNLDHLPFAVGLSRATSGIIRQNLWLSLGVVALLVPSTVLGLSIGAAVLAHEGSTVVVVLNALRLLAFRNESE
jgi:Cd2+/Zn2+-exporting ATPase